MRIVIFVAIFKLFQIGKKKTGRFIGVWLKFPDRFADLSHWL